MTDADQLLAAWKKNYGELFPGRDPELMRYEDSALALGVTLEQRFRAFIEEQADKPTPLVNLRQRSLDRLSGYNRKDQE